MKKIYFSLLLTLVLSLLATTSFADDAEIDGIYYNLSETEAAVTSGTNKYSGDVIIPESIVYEGSSYSITAITNRAFHSCSALTSVTIPESVTSIGRTAFYGCSNLKSIILPSKMKVIGNYTFYGCSSLTSIIIPNSVTSIGYNAFQNCSSLTSITIPNSVTSIGDEAFSGCSSLTSITISNSVTMISYEAFTGCSNLTSITIPNSVTIIGMYAFSGCSALASVTIPNSVTVISDGAFYKCRRLTSVTIPNSVTVIGDYAFWYCDGLVSVVSLIEKPFPISNNTFTKEKYDNSTLYVPTETLELYKETEGWKNFMHIVEGIPVGISTIGRDISTALYDLSGRRVSPSTAPKGIYIQGKHKIIKQ